MCLSWSALLNMSPGIHRAKWEKDFISKLLTKTVSCYVHPREHSGRKHCHLLSVIRLSFHYGLTPARLWPLAPSSRCRNRDQDVLHFSVDSTDDPKILRSSVVTPLLPMKRKANIERGRNADPKVVFCYSLWWPHTQKRKFKFGEPAWNQVEETGNTSFLKEKTPWFLLPSQQAHSAVLHFLPALLQNAWGVAVYPGPCGSRSQQSVICGPEARGSNLLTPVPQIANTFYLIPATIKGIIYFTISAHICEKPTIRSVYDDRGF